jgi:hypothetical protein
MTTNQFEWVQENPKSLLLHWTGLPFQYSQIIVWRGIELPIKIECEKTEFGYTTLISFVYKNKVYPCRLTKWKYSGGGNGIYPPDVNTAKYHLKIRFGMDFIRFEDELIDPTTKEENEKPATIILKGIPNQRLFHIPQREECPFMDSSTDGNRLDLYVYKDKKQTIEVSGSNSEHNFIVSYYDSNQPEREDEAIYIKKKDLHVLCHIFNMKKTCGSELLIILKNKFDGKNYYVELKKFLERRNVPFNVLYC